MKNYQQKKEFKMETFSFEDMYAEISQAWEKKAKELQARRWQKIKQKEKLVS